MNANQLVKIKPNTVPNDSRHTVWKHTDILSLPPKPIEVIPTTGDLNLITDKIEYVYRDNSVYPPVMKLTDSLANFTDTDGLIANQLKAITTGYQLNPDTQNSNGQEYLVYHYDDNTLEYSVTQHNGILLSGYGVYLPIINDWNDVVGYEVWLKDSINNMIQGIRAGKIIADINLKNVLATGQMRVEQTFIMEQGKTLADTTYAPYSNELHERSGDFTENSVTTDGYIIANFSFTPIFIE